MKRFLSLAAALCAICMLFSSCSFVPAVSYVIQGIDEIMDELRRDDPDPSSSSEPSRSTDDGQALTVRELEEKYGFEFLDEDGLLSGPEGEENCARVDEALTVFSKPFIDSFLAALARRDVTFHMEFLDENNGNLGETDYGYQTICIRIFAPRNSPDPALTNGITVETIAHELGHAIHDELENQNDASEIKATWESLNGPYSYGDEWDEGCNAYFTYDYALTDYYEDVATVFEDLAAYPITLTSRISQPENTALYLKAKYLHTLMSLSFDLSGSSLFAPYESARQKRGDGESFGDSYRRYTEENGWSYGGWDWEPEDWLSPFLDGLAA